MIEYIINLYDRLSTNIIILLFDFLYNYFRIILYFDNEENIKLNNLINKYKNKINYYESLNKDLLFFINKIYIIGLYKYFIASLILSTKTDNFKNILNFDNKKCFNFLREKRQKSLIYLEASMAITFKMLDIKPTEWHIKNFLKDHNINVDDN